MKLFRLGKQGKFRSMTVFHTMARMGIEGLVLVEPDHYFVCLGYFDDARAMVDFEFCAKRGISVMRREVGGGVVLLGPGQLFYQLVIMRGDPRLPFTVEQAYKKFSLAPIAAYRRLGISVNYKPVNDLVTKERRKISGQGAADIGPCFVFVGNMLLDFDPWLMSRCIKVADEKFRAKLCCSMEKNLSWVGKELATLPESAQIEEILKEEFERLLGPLEDTEVPRELWAEADRLARHLTSEEFVFLETPRQHGAIKVREGTYLRHGVHRTSGGLIAVDVEVEDSKIAHVAIAGDFLPACNGEMVALSEALRGVDFDFQQVAKKIAELLENSTRYRGVKPEDFAWAIVGEKRRG